jgi:peptidyl-prolyl cis-trans isomerase SurA
MLFTVREKVLNGLIDQKLTDQEIKRANIDVSEAEVDATIERIKESRFLTDEELRQVLKQQNLSMEEYRSQIKTQILRTKLINIEVKSKIVITQQDVAAYYKDHSEIYGGEKRYHLRNILMKPPMMPSETEEKAFREKMASIVKDLKNGASFAEMAREYSQSPLAADGGDLGAFELKALSPQIRDAVKDLKPGQFTEILSTDQGYQLFYIEDILESPAKPLKEVSGEIREKLFNEIVDSKFQSWLADLRKRSHIRIIK